MQQKNLKFGSFCWRYFTFYGIETDNPKTPKPQLSNMLILTYFGIDLLIKGSNNWQIIKYLLLNRKKKMESHQSLSAEALEKLEVQPNLKKKEEATSWSSIFKEYVKNHPIHTTVDKICADYEVSDKDKQTIRKAKSDYLKKINTQSVISIQPTTC